MRLPRKRKKEVKKIVARKTASKMVPIESTCKAISDIVGPSGDASRFTTIYDAWRNLE